MKYSTMQNIPTRELSFQPFPVSTLLPVVKKFTLKEMFPPLLTLHTVAIFIPAVPTRCPSVKSFIQLQPFFLKTTPATAISIQINRSPQKNPPTENGEGFKQNNKIIGDYLLAKTVAAVTRYIFYIAMINGEGSTLPWSTLMIDKTLSGLG